MPPQPANPEPAPDFDSMLSRKFGQEVANYFSGNPLNRVAFLRGDYKFLGQALKHQSTNFLLCNGLQPLIDPAKKDRLAWVKYDDVKPVIGEEPYKASEDEMIAQYNSDTYIPQMIFLGLDEKVKEGSLGYQGKNFYQGAPYFAVDVTPKKSVTDACEKLIKDLESRGLQFSKGRVMDIVASDGKCAKFCPQT